jgi:hypothetical protein
MSTRILILCLFSLLLVAIACATSPAQKPIDGVTSDTSGLPDFLYGVWGNSSSDIFAGGFKGSILHYDGKILDAMTSGTTNAIYDIWGSSSSDVFAVGSLGTILHYDGKAWGTMISGTLPKSYRHLGQLFLRHLRRG